MEWYLLAAGFVAATIGLFSGLWRIYRGVRVLDTRVSTVGLFLVALGPDRTVSEFVRQHDNQRARLITHEQAIAQNTDGLVVVNRRLEHHGELLDELVANTSAMRGLMETQATDPRRDRDDRS